MEKATKQEEKAAKPGPLVCCSHKSCSSLSSSEATTSRIIINPNLDVQYTDQPNNNRFHLNHNQLRELKLPRRPPVDLEFKDIRYTVTEYSLAKFTRTKKEILHGIEGCFKSGELTAIMGPSGAGKSSLLNILAGLTTRGMSGTVLVNGKVRLADEPEFQRLSRYIQQDDSLRPYLTVEETMTITAHLKLGYSISDAEKKKQIEDTLTMLGLEKTFKVLTINLSGGQRKRLAIALELLSNPPILFLDEPTTGLDSSSCSQCISLLKRLSQEGRTIICTIHQPSALLFEMFDKLYALANGFCIYRGPVKELIPFLGSQGFVCPPFHNPADYLIEIAIDDHNVDLEKMSEAASLTAKEENKKELQSKDKDKNGNGIVYGNNYEDSYRTKNSSISSYSTESDLKFKGHTRANQLQQTWLLYKRNLITSSRKYSLLLSRFIAHILIGIIFGYLYYDVGQNAETVLANYIYLYGSLLLVVYTGKMSVTLSFPLEMEILKREHFNKWYNLFPFIISTLAVEVPFQAICCASYISISYIMTGNLLVKFRLLYFFFISISTSLCAQAWGYFIGATTPVKIAVFVGPVLAVLLSVFGFCIRLFDTPIFFQWMFHASYFRAGFHSLVYSVYGMTRGKLQCEGTEFKYCHYKSPEKFLKEMDIMNIDIWGNMGLVIGLGLIMHLLTAGALWCRLNRR